MNGTIPSSSQGNKWDERGVTLTEMLVVLAIVGLLATIAVPVYVSRIRLAQISTAKSETREIAESQLQVLAIHGFFVPIQVLDDIPEVDGVTTTQDDTIDEDRGIGISLIDPYVVLSPTPTQLDLQDDDNNQRVSELVNFWQGPFIRTKRVYIGDAASDDPEDVRTALGSDGPSYDHPLDPWGQPYRFYSPIGIIGSGALSTDSSNFVSNNFSDGVLTSNDDRFDRYAIVSFGPDGDRDSTTNNDDDIIYFFGPVVSETTLNIVF